MNDLAHRKRLVRAVYSDTCEEFTETMYLYALAERHGENPAEKYSDFKHHMDICEECAASYQDLLLLMEAEDSASWIAPEEAPALPPPWLAQTETPAPAEPLAGGNGIRVWITRQGQTLARLVVDLSSMKALSPQMQVRSQTRRLSGEEPEQEFALDTTQIQGIQDAELRFSIAPDSAMPDRRELRVEVNLPERWPDFSGTTVHLRKAVGETTSMVTGRSGTVRFHGLSLEEIQHSRIEITLP